MGTLIEEILSRKAGHDVHAGEIVLVDVDYIMSHDNTTPLAIKAFNEIGKPILEGGLVNSAAGSMFSYYIQSETSMNCAGFPTIVHPATFDFTTSFMSSLKGTITDKNNNVISRVYLNINNEPYSKTISLSVSISNPDDTTTGFYSFDVPSSDLKVAPAGKTANQTVTATDANGCTATANVTITQPASALSVVANGVNVKRFTVRAS